MSALDDPDITFSTPTVRRIEANLSVLGLPDERVVGKVRVAGSPTRRTIPKMWLSRMCEPLNVAKHIHDATPASDILVFANGREFGRILLPVGAGDECPDVSLWGYINTATPSVSECLGWMLAVGAQSALPLYYSIFPHAYDVVRSFSRIPDNLSDKELANHIEQGEFKDTVMQVFTDGVKMPQPLNSRHYRDFLHTLWRLCRLSTQHSDIVT